MFKSIKTGVLALILVSTAIIARAQTVINEGVATYSMEANGMKNDTKVKFNGDISSFSLQMGPALVVITTDHKNSLGLVTVDVPVAQQQVAAKMTKADLDAELENAPKYTEFTATGEKQTIAGYNAEKYNVKAANGTMYELWTTTDVSIPANGITKPFAGAKGTLVKFSGEGTSILLKSIKAEKVGELSVAKIPSGYDEMTYSELRAMGGGGE